MPHTASLTQSVSLSPDAANLAQTTAASDSLPSDSGDTGLDKARESGTSWGRSSEERRREGSQSEQGGAGRDTKVFCRPIFSLFLALVDDICLPLLGQNSSACKFILFAGRVLH